MTFLVHFYTTVVELVPHSVSQQGLGNFNNL